MNPSFKYVLPEKLRSTLKQPIGQLVDEQTLLQLIDTGKKIVSIGDQVTYTLLKHDVPPLFCVIDFHTKRKETFNEIKKTLRTFGEKTVNVENPPGTITTALWEIIQKTYQEDVTAGITVRIEVSGEEDLAALPAILFAPRDVTIIYGLPDKGVVVVPSEKQYKEKVKNILAEM